MRLSDRAVVVRETKYRDEVHPEARRKALLPDKQQKAARGKWIPNSGIRLPVPALTRAVVQYQ